MNASFIRERQWYSAVVTAGPLRTHLILFAIPMWKNISTPPHWCGCNYTITPPTPTCPAASSRCLPTLWDGGILITEIWHTSVSSGLCLSLWTWHGILFLGWDFSPRSSARSADNSLMKPWPPHAPFDVTRERCAAWIWMPWDAFLNTRSSSAGGWRPRPQGTDKQPSCTDAHMAKCTVCIHVCTHVPILCEFLLASLIKRLR